MWHKSARENSLKKSAGRGQNTELTFTYTISELSVTADIRLDVDDQMFPFLDDTLINCLPGTYWYNACFTVEAVPI